jgi:thioester reductase-like protein
LLKNESVTILALVRGDSDEDAARKIAREWWDWPELTNSLGSRTEVIRGDVSLSNLGLDEPSYKKCPKKQPTLFTLLLIGGLYPSMS